MFNACYFERTKGGKSLLFVRALLLRPLEVRKDLLRKTNLTGCSVDTEANCSLYIILHILVVFKRMRTGRCLLFVSVPVFRAFFSPFPRFKVA